jgi:hypothetical protein
VRALAACKTFFDWFRGVKLSVPETSRKLLIAGLGDVVRYSNGYDSGQSSHNFDSSKKMFR